jgi:uncharacterized lipoprotein NlpE involved in copper resistance
MKKSIILGLFVVSALVSCKNQAEAPAEAAPVEAPAAEAPAADTTAAAVDTTVQQ